MRDLLAPVIITPTIDEALLRLPAGARIRLTRVLMDRHEAPLGEKWRLITDLRKLTDTYFEHLDGDSFIVRASHLDGLISRFRVVDVLESTRPVTTCVVLEDEDGPLR